MNKTVSVFASVAAVIAMPINAETTKPSARLHRDMAPVLIGDVGHWFGSDAYPVDAVRANRQGRVVAAIGIDSAGKVVSCTIKVSSGTESLDKKTCEIAIANLVFDPATDHQGLPTASVFLLPVMWQLPEAAAPPPIDLSTGLARLDMAVQVTFDAGGTVLNCKLLSLTTPTFPAGSTTQKPDPCAAFIVGTKTTHRWLRAGQPVGAVVVQRYSEDYTATP